MADDAVHDVYRKSEYIAGELRAQIVKGDYRPGSRLPTRDELVTRYRVSKVTIQRAYAQLKEEGFVQSRVGSGTIVAPDSPHLTSYAMLFPHGQEATGHNQFWYALAAEAERLDDGRKVALHYGFEGGLGIERFLKLVEDVEHRRLAGLIFAAAPIPLANTPLVEQPGIPRVCFMSRSTEFAIPSVTMDGASLRRQMAAHAVASGAQRVAVIAPDQMKVEAVAEVVAECERQGLRINPDWVQGVSRMRPEWGQGLVRLLMSGPVETRPDCLLLLEDNLLPAISEALLGLGIVPPRDLELIAHCNFPWPSPSAVPAVRIGYCVTECLQALLQQIDAQRQGLPPSPHTVLPAYHERDYPHPIHWEKSNSWG